jgi:hypothetical protein
MFPHRNTQKFAWASPNGKTQNRVKYNLIDSHRYSSLLEDRSFRAADCDTNHYLVVAKCRDRLAVNKQRSRRFHMERLSLKKLNEEVGKEKYRIEGPNRFAALEYLDAEIKIKRLKKRFERISKFQP